MVAGELTCDTCWGAIDPAFWYTWVATSLVATVVSWKVVKPPTVWPRWILGNFMRFLGAFVLVWWAWAAIDAALSTEPRWGDTVAAPFTALVFFGLVYFPGVVVYLLGLGCYRLGGTRSAVELRRFC